MLIKDVRACQTLTNRKHVSVDLPSRQVLRCRSKSVNVVPTLHHVSTRFQEEHGLGRMANIAVNGVETVGKFCKGLEHHVVTRMTMDHNTVIVSLFEFHILGLGRTRHYDWFLLKGVTSKTTNNYMFVLFFLYS